MLDILEFNAGLYSALEKKRNDKETILNYGRQLQHASTESNIELQIAEWIANFKGITQSDKFNKTPEGSKEVCEKLIPECAKLIRKANKKKAPQDSIDLLKNARQFLDTTLELANEAISKKSYNQNAPSYARHSEEDDTGLQHKNGYKYLYITDSGRYVYPEDIKRQKERKPVLMPRNEMEKAANANRDLRNAKESHENLKNSIRNASNADVDKIVNQARQNTAAAKLMKSAVDAEKANRLAKQEAARADQNARAYDNNKAAADAQKRALQSTGPVAQQKIEAAKSNNYQNNRKAEEAQKIANQQNSTIGKQKAEEQKAQQYQNNVNASYHYEQDKADRDRLNNVTNPDDKWLNKQAANGNYSALQKRNDLILDRQNAQQIRLMRLRKNMTKL